jgi:hypothetical protein
LDFGGTGEGGGDEGEAEPEQNIQEAIHERSWWS